ncbi:hypothetical protein NE237_014569 [Protea cynaroides]|uniref:Calreticulin n=1 Tax=Protea cynaroides TaxID=273540 RepID=A0A9Q0KC93_9MAGN|nr:hypothetical protein NE237_014569 [Protea cynaroides]
MFPPFPMLPLVRSEGSIINMWHSNLIHTTIYSPIGQSYVCHSKILAKPVKIKEASGVVLQFKSRHQRGLDCGGSYVKILGPQKPGWTPKEFDSESPYSIMFGPDNNSQSRRDELLILTDGEAMHKANFTAEYDFKPPIIPPVTILDPDDQKPEKWDDRAKIPDINAIKQDDWDEDTPAEIDDEVP